MSRIGAMAARLLGAKTEVGEEQQAKRLLDAYCKEIGRTNWGIKPRDYAAGRAILDAEPKLQIGVLFAILDEKDRYWVLTSLQNSLLAHNLPWTATDLERLLACIHEKEYFTYGWSSELRPVQRFLEQGNRLTPAMETALRAMRTSLQTLQNADARKLHARLSELLGETKSALPDAGETWADAALADVGALPQETQAAWKRLFAQAQDSENARPTSAWRKESKACIAAVGEEPFREHVVRWFTAVTAPPMQTLRHEYNGRVYETHQSGGSDRNISLLKGLAWMCADRTETEVARALARLTEVCLKKLPGIGPWAVRAATAAIWSLTEMEGAEAIGQLGRLKTKVTFRTALNQIEKGLESAAQRAGVTKADLEDLSVPAYGFDPGGVRREAFGDCAAVATLTPNGELTVEWFVANGKAVKSVPASVKQGHAAALKEFKADVDAAAKMLTAQKARFDSFYLPESVWTLRDWRERFANHPILGHIARRLIWHFSDGEHRAQGIWNDAQQSFVDVRDAPISWLADGVEVRLWHPIGFDVDVVLQWRNYLQQSGIMQPFKQAYREVYLLTEAELRTHTYSNRFAGHILKQHQMNSLAALRGWNNKLRLMVDDIYPPASKELPEFGLRAEFWIEGAGDTYGTDTTESGTYLYLTTDQVRFYRMGVPENYAHAGGGGYTSGRWGGAEPGTPLPLTEVPALVFSEIMRDVDMFVGVCSVGNDPAWQDGGPQGRYQNYWSDYSFGDLSATAQTRRDVLERLLPRLRIAARCSLADKFLVVRGNLRTYKIHLGSGNILMEPNDQYLCIVQDRSTGRGEDTVRFLPFEGDQRLALILSKAFLLADDTRITDPTITRQIRP
jgi:hypothetical protein